MSLNISIFVIIAIIVAMTWSEGLWGNLLSLCNAVLAATIATNLFEPAADFMEGQAPGLTYFWDFLCFWMLFAFLFGIFRAITDQVSPTKVRFRIPLDVAGGGICGVLTAWVVVCIFVFSLHMAPTKRTSFGGAFGDSPTSSHFFMTPDLLWLGYAQSRSEGALSRSEPRVFDEDSEFILKYGQRRQDLSGLPGLTVDSRGRRR